MNEKVRANVKAMAHAEKKAEKLRKKRAKHKVKSMLKAILAIILVLFMVGLAVAPVFAVSETKSFTPVQFEYNFLNQQLYDNLDAKISYSIAGDKLATEIITDITPDTSADASGNSVNIEEAQMDLEDLMQIIESNYYQDVDESALIEGAYKGMLDVLDLHSTYYSQTEYEDLLGTLSGEFVGIGASITKSDDDYIDVIAPIKDMPAEKAGLKAGDVIVSVDGESTLGWSTEKAASLIRGEEGTDVVLGIRRSPSTEIFDLTVTRGVITISTVSYKMLEDGIGYINITQFGAKTNDEFDDAMAYMMNNDVQKLIIDVRNNPGGYLNAALHISDYFVEKGRIIVKEVLNGGKTQVFRASADAVPTDVAVLVNGGSASASEIFSGSIQQTNAGTIIGTTTYGKGTVQVPYDLDYAGAVKLTIAEYVLSHDYHVDGVGIIPDIEISNPTESDYLDYLDFVPMNEKDTKRFGDTSLNVYGAQQRLNLLGESLTVDGKLGYNTEAALKRFQESNGITPTGLLDRETVTKLQTNVDALFDGTRDLQLERAIRYFSEGE